MSNELTPQEPDRGRRRLSLQRFRRDEGLTTTEYAVGTVAVAGLGTVLLKLLTSDWMMDLITRVIEWAFSSLFGG